MKPSSPVFPPCNEIVIAKDQPPYKPLPAVEVDENTILTRWHMTWRERITALFRGDVYLYVMTFGQPLQPLSMQATKPRDGNKTGGVKLMALRLRARCGWLWRIGIIERSTAFRWEVDASLGEWS